jgi:hypothetical protein
VPSASSTVASKQQLSGFRVDDQVVELRCAVRFELDVPRKSCSAVNRKPLERRRDLTTEGSLIEAGVLRIPSDTNRHERSTRSHVGGGGRGGALGRDRGVPSPTGSPGSARRYAYDGAVLRDVNGDGCAEYRHAIETLRESDVPQSRRLADIVADDGERIQILVVETETIGGLLECRAEITGWRRWRDAPTRRVEHTDGARVRVQARQIPALTPPRARQLVKGACGPARRSAIGPDIEIRP